MAQPVAQLPTDAQAATADDFSVMVDFRHHDAILTVSGQLDLASSEALTAEGIRTLHPPVRSLLLDFAGVTFCGAAGITALIRIHNAASTLGIRLVLTRVQPQVRHILALAGTNSLIPVGYSREPLEDHIKVPRSVRSA